MLLAMHSIAGNAQVIHQALGDSSSTPKMASMPARPYDSLYDPTYTVSGARDHYRQQGQSGGFLVEKVPEHANMFSELQHYPTSTFKLKGNDRVPAFIDRSFHPHQAQPGQLKRQSGAAQVNGPQQFKYFRRPHLPPGTRPTLPLHLAPQQPPPPVQPAPPEPLIKDAATQSDYRENETQTLPWSPDWVLPKDPAVLAKQAVLSAKYHLQGPEVLQLADLKFGDGLPGGLQEVRRLEKMREKRAFEASLPAIDDAEHLPQRQAMIEAWEAAEWAEREEEIQGVQEERLALLEQALKVREEEIEESHKAQVEQRTAALLAGKASKFAAIHASRIKTIRQLAAKRKQVDALAKPSQQKASIIDKYADYGSPVYAPLQREGRFPDAIKPPAAAVTGPAASWAAGKASALQQAAAPLDVDRLGPTTLAGLQELQASLPARSLQPKLHKPKPPAKLSYSQRVEAAVQHDVESINTLLQASKATHGRGVGQVWPYPIDQPGAAGSNSFGSGSGSGISKGTARSVGGVSVLAAAGAAEAASSSRPAAIAKAAMKERPTTPAAPPLPDADGQHAALVLLQRLLRGRAVQNEVYAGKTAQLQLVRELRLGREGTAGCQPQPEVCDAATQELDAAIGAALCRLCCLLSSDDEAGITQLLSSIASRQQQREGAGEGEEQLPELQGQHHLEGQEQQQQQTQAVQQQQQGHDEQGEDQQQQQQQQQVQGKQLDLACHLEEEPGTALQTAEQLTQVAHLSECLPDLQAAQQQLQASAELQSEQQAVQQSADAAEGATQPGSEDFTDSIGQQLVGDAAGDFAGLGDEAQDHGIQLTSSELDAGESLAAAAAAPSSAAGVDAPEYLADAQPLQQQEGPSEQQQQQQQQQEAVSQGDHPALGSADGADTCVEVALPSSKTWQQAASAVAETASNMQPDEPAAAEAVMAAAAAAPTAAAAGAEVTTAEQQNASKEASAESSTSEAAAHISEASLAGGVLSAAAAVAAAADGAGMDDVGGSLATLDLGGHAGATASSFLFSEGEGPSTPAGVGVAVVMSLGNALVGEQESSGPGGLPHEGSSRSNSSSSSSSSSGSESA